MTEISHPDNRTDREHRYRSPGFPPRYPTLAAPNETVVEWARTLPVGSSILDVGCGVGRHLIYLGGRGFWMSGVDRSACNIRTAKSMCDERQPPLDAHVADMTALPWADGTFDAALSTSTIVHHLRKDIVKTLGEVWRILRPGGFFLVEFLHKETPGYLEVRDQVNAGELSEVEPDTFVARSQEPDLREDGCRLHHECDEAEVRDLLSSFEILKLRADLPPRSAHERLARRGVWLV